MGKTVSIAEVADIRRQRVNETFQLDPLVKINLKGNDYTLELNNYAVKGVLKDTSINLMSTGFGAEQMQDPILMGSVLYWGLKTSHPELTQDDVDKMYNYRHFAYVLGKVTTALSLFLPDMSDVVVDEAIGRTNTEESADPL